MPPSPPASRLLLALILGASLLTACGGEDSATLVKEAQLKIAAGDIKAATIQLKNAIDQDDNNAEARFELGKLYLAQLDLASAEKEFRRAREAGIAAGTVNPLIARTLLMQQEYQRILDELPAPGDSSNEAATLLALRATAELGLRQADDARNTLKRAQQIAPDNPWVHLALAQLALADRDLALAMQETDQALRLDPKHEDALIMKGDLLRASGQETEAIAAYREVIRLNPQNSNTRLALAGIAIKQNQLSEARKHVDAALKITPNSLQARYTEALIDFQEKKTGRARDHLAAVLKTAPDFVPALLLGGAIEFALGNMQTAEAHLNKVIKAAPGNVYALRLLAAAQLRLGRPDDAERTLAPALKAAQVDAGVLVVAGEIALAQKDFPKASGYFEQAARLSPGSADIRTELGISRLAQGDARALGDLQSASDMAGGGSRADSVIILDQLKRKQFDAALASIDALEKKQAATPLSWNYRAAAYLGKRDNARARESLSQALKLDPAFFPAAANLAQLDLQDKQPAAARQRFEGILKADPKHLNAMLMLAELAQREQDEKAYVAWLEKAASVHPQALQPRIALARYLLAKGDRNKALSVAREAVNAQPDNAAALELLGTTQLSLGDTANALNSYRKLVERQPGKAEPLVKLAGAQIVAKDFAGARKTLQDALRIQPDLLDAQVMLVGVDIQGARLDDALKQARQVQQQKPANPAGYVLEGDVAYARKDYPAALAALERAQQLAPSGALLARQLKVLSAMQRPKEGEKRLAAWLATQPKDTSSRAVLAESLIKRKQFAAASEHYLLLNASNPNNLLILNNLAWALFESGDKRAATYAEQALKLAPNNPAVMDTLGWILVQQKQTARGIKLLQQALSKSPDAAEIQYHLAAAYAQTGDTARARSELERLLGNGLAFPQEAEARALLQQLQAKAR
ncbi:XrtA/PEP-CTERM system TPR-repeat protein PrsT [Thiobacillus sp.]|uniref:XrtA/PEP-CTERM system TPR-repeat protein PrsT n=1 Tax=Thiobacillus sp. TaxID=924 RepID=UPI00286DADF4|nr:XrtA/PEP-CTERM system TPR-repeat protein PrsT [Thiobacillus sp.]